MKKPTLSTVSKVYSVFRTARGVFTTVTRPARWVRDTIRDTLIAAFIKIALGAVKDGHKAAISARVSNIKRTVYFSVPVPSVLRRHFSADAGTLNMLHELANDALEIPMALIGYRLGLLQLSWDEATHSVKACLELAITATSDNRTAESLALEAPRPEQQDSLKSRSLVSDEQGLNHKP